MNSDVERFLKGESKNSYNYFGAHKVSDGACFRVYAPHAKDIEVIVNEKSYKMDRVDFRGVYETRVKEVKEFDKYHYEIFSNGVWMTKNDPFTFYSEDDKSVYVDKDEFIFEDDKWMSKEREDTYFNACLLNEEFKMDEQREFINYLKKCNYNYVILKPYKDKNLYCVRECFINESSLKNFINNLHQVNVGVLFEFDTDCFFDYGEGLDNFDGEALYNLENEKYNDVNRVYFDYSKNHTRSYIQSFINYYMSNFHGDGLYLNESEFNKELIKEYDGKLVIFKGNENKEKIASDNYFLNIINNLNEEFNYKKFLELSFDNNTYFIYDYKKLMTLIKGNEQYKKEIARMLLAMFYVSNAFCISTYNSDEDYLKAVELLSNLYSNSKCLSNKGVRNLLYNGKKNNYFAYEFSSRNDYVVMFINFGDYEDEKFDLGMPYYGYYKLIIDTKTNTSNDELFSTRSKKIHDKSLAMKINVKSNQVLVYKRMKDI